MPRIIAHIDMDCFFCACEVKRNPDIKGKPVVVGGMSGRGVVAAASYEAREFGVFSATPMQVALERCPDLIAIKPDKDWYRKESKEIMSILKRYGMLRQVSVDEAYVDLTEMSERFPSLEALAADIQKVMVNETGLTCSIGIAESKTVAKIASDYKKPAGVTIVKDAKEFLKDMPVKKIPGIGEKTTGYYYDHGVKTIGDLAKMDRFKVLDIFGMQGVKYQRVALGLDQSRLEPTKDRKSQSRERTFHNDVSSFAELKARTRAMVRRLMMDLGQTYFRTVSIKLRFSDFTTLTKDRSFSIPVRSQEALYEAAVELLEQVYDADKKIRLLGVKASHLTARREYQKTLIDFF